MIRQRCGPRKVSSTINFPIAPRFNRILFLCQKKKIVPGITEFAALNSITDRDDGVPSWTRGLSQEDINAMHRKYLLTNRPEIDQTILVHLMQAIYFSELGALSHAGLIAEIKKLYDQAYQLGVEEAREMTRGKYLNIFTPSNRKK